MVKRAVITGVGAVSALGFGRARLWEGLLAGEVGVRPIRSFDASGLEVGVAAEVPVVDASPAWVGSLAGGSAGRVAEGWAAKGAAGDRKLAFALVAGAEALRDAGLSSPPGALVVGLGLERARLADFAPLTANGGEPVDTPGPAGSVHYRVAVDAPARALAEAFDVRKNIETNVSACAASTLALIRAARLVTRGRVAVALVGGADSMINPLGIGGMSRLGAPSPRASADACRPFDRRRDGLAMGEGAAFFVVEEEESAKARGARIYGALLGGASTQDAYKATAPRPDAERQAAAMTRALAKARVTPEALGWVSAHGTGTPLNDPAEARAMHRALEGVAARIPTSSIKGSVGHLMAAAGAIEVAAALLAFAEDQIPPTANHEELDPACELDVVAGAPRAAHVDYILKSSFGFGGQNASLVLGRPR